MHQKARWGYIWTDGIANAWFVMLRPRVYIMDSAGPNGSLTLAHGVAQHLRDRLH